jgi:hypothetical protein
MQLWLLLHRQLVVGLLMELQLLMLVQVHQRHLQQLLLLLLMALQLLPLMLTIQLHLMLGLGSRHAHLSWNMTLLTQVLLGHVHLLWHHSGKVTLHRHGTAVGLPLDRAKPQPYICSRDKTTNKTKKLQL